LHSGNAPCSHHTDALSLRVHSLAVDFGENHSSPYANKLDVLHTRQETNAVKKYLLALYHPGGDADVPPRDVLDKIMREVAAIREEMKACGVWVFSGGLDSLQKAAVLRLQERKVLVTDGPFIESKEHIGGLTIIQVPDQDAALVWARKLVQATGMPIEVRPFVDHCAD
jgi:hypothetical protein